MEQRKQSKGYLLGDIFYTQDEFNKLSSFEKLGFLPVKYNTDKQKYEVCINDNDR